ncbi:Nif3-like dinuclear metal center hexameric protein [cf. Phormidesmis sp. LEGE 11477]|uniref:Nif3-like dinuclear metal center hexameric protein n=1 Tax=cf. Phormidesmis sp. LEGE 11477 TaxID=1828680 RepID=UPI0018812FF8|nr:Nif3-like dinuclear metal center hexameric protein [cf. Phormidesmis sp. LEGE 11477]MBE9061575.1 Nif3-like dinuclear metal center hexameric protein [cf. Phormidesmis sp. LEGE 11477]
MIISDVISTFEQWANPTWQEKWDNCGWQVEPDILREPAGILVCLTPTLAVMHEAIALKANGLPVNLIFAHHPLIFGGLSSVMAGDSVGDMIRLAIAHDIGIYTAHTNFDQVADGTADVLAQQLDLQAIAPVVPTAPGQDTARGYGRVGNLLPAQTLQQLLEKIQSVMAPPRLLYSPAANLQQSIERIAVLGGSGASYINAVKQTGAQAYLTADCKFHQFQASRDQDLVLIDAGHYATERPACQKLVGWFQRQGVTWSQLSEQDEDFRQFF